MIFFLIFIFSEICNIPLGPVSSCVLFEWTPALQVIQMTSFLVLEPAGGQGKASG